MTSLGLPTCLVILCGSPNPHPGSICCDQICSQGQQSQALGTHFDLQAWPTSTSPTFLQHWNLNTVFSIQYTWHFSPKYLPSVSLLESLIQWDAMGFGVRQNEFHCYIHQGQQAEKVQRWIWACRVVLAVQKSSEASWWHREQANPSGVLVLVGLPLDRCDWLIGPPACECKWLSH